jgi:hypothetical protein
MFFRYITPTEKLLLIFGTIGAVLAGSLYPAYAVILGQITNAFSPDNTS